jgi:hypothetical protein
MSGGRMRKPSRRRKRGLALGKVTVVSGVPSENKPNEIVVEAAKSSFNAVSKDGKILGMSKTTFGIAVGVLALAGIIYAVKKKK